MSRATARTGYSHLLREIDDLRAQRGVTEIALVLLQLDGVGEVNKSLGYPAGDEVLDRIAERMAGVGRAQDRIVALSKGVFALLVRNPLHQGHAVLAAEKAIRVASEPVELADGRRGSGPGRAYPSCRRLPRRRASFSGNAKWRSRRLRAGTRRTWPTRRRLTVAIRVDQSVWFEIDDALHRGEFELHFQPKVNLRTVSLAAPRRSPGGGTRSGAWSRRCSSYRPSRAPTAHGPCCGSCLIPACARRQPGWSAGPGSPSR